MRAIQMKGRVGGKRIRGYLWAGTGKDWAKKENYFQLESEKLVSACFASSTGEFWIRCKGGTCEITLKSQRGRVLGTTTLALPFGKIR